MIYSENQNQSQAGHTLVELIMAMMMSGIVMGSIFVLVSGSHKYLIKGRETLNFQQDFSLVETLLSTNVRQALGGEQKIYSDYDDYVAGIATQDSGSCLQLKFDSGDSCVIYQTDSDIEIIDTNLSNTTLIQGKVSDLLFVQQENAIQTELTLSLNNKSIQNVFYDAFRIFASSESSLGNRRAELVIQSSQVPGDLTNFPLLLTEDNLPEEILDSNSDYTALDGGGDIRFSSDEAGTNRLACDIVTFLPNNNPSQAEAEIWVKVPVISSSSNTSIWVWYYTEGASQPAEPEEFGSESVWENNYELVMHLNETPTGSAPQFTDATSNDYDGSNSGGISNSDLIDAVFSNGINFDGSWNDDINLGIWNVIGSQVTIQHWVQVDGSPYFDADFFSRATGTGTSNYWMMTGFDASGSIIPRFRLKIDGSTTTLEGGTLSSNTWNFMAATYDGSKMRIWLNTGNVTSSSASGTISTSSSANNFLGGNPVFLRQLNGKLDEVRISSVRRSDNWLLAEYRNQSVPATFVVAEMPESP